MTDIRSRIVEVAASCIGTREGSPEHKTIIDIYNGYAKKVRPYKMTLKDPWCAAFVSAVFIAAGQADRIPIDCSCFYLKNLAAGRKILRDKARYIPKPGDLILYKWSGKKNVVSHIGIVSVVDGSMLEVIEGNYKDAVGVRKIKLSYKFIDSYIEVI